VQETVQPYLQKMGLWRSLIAILGFVFNLALDAVEHAIMPWRNRDA
jgi:ABC-type nitrate/sulfonate/bicarbonate transport system permease component